VANTAHPDIDVIQDAVRDAIDRSEGDYHAEAKAPATKKRKKQADTEPVTGGSVGSLKDGYVANDTDDVAAAC
jgi:hypothetical protein